MNYEDYETQVNIILRWEECSSAALDALIKGAEVGFQGECLNAQAGNQYAVPYKWAALIQKLCLQKAELEAGKNGI